MRRARQRVSALSQSGEVLGHYLDAESGKVAVVGKVRGFAFGHRFLVDDSADILARKARCLTHFKTFATAWVEILKDARAAR